MPIYEYKCARCGHTLEAIQKVSDAALTKCPACHKKGLRKRVSAAAFHLKGSGWYVTDFRNKPKDKASGEKTSGETASNTKASGKEDAKPATTEKSESAKKTKPAATG